MADAWDSNLTLLLNHPRVDAAALDSRGRHFLFYWDASASLLFPRHFSILELRAAELGLDPAQQVRHRLVWVCSAA